MVCFCNYICTVTTFVCVYTNTDVCSYRHSKTQTYTYASAVVHMHLYTNTHDTTHQISDTARKDKYNDTLEVSESATTHRGKCIPSIYVCVCVCAYIHRKHANATVLYVCKQSYTNTRKHTYNALLSLEVLGDC